MVIQNGSDKKRAAIYTNGAAEEIGAERIVQLICWRWGKENAIKELLHKHLINYTPGYLLEELDEQPLVDNPEVGELKKQRAGLVSELNRLKIELADHLIERPAKKRRTPRRSRKEVLDDITVVEGKILLAHEQLDKLPSEIRFDLANDGKKLLKRIFPPKKAPKRLDFPRKSTKYAVLNVAIYYCLFALDNVVNLCFNVAMNIN